MIKLVCFDLDGVLVDAAEWHYEALNEALDWYGYCTISRYDHIHSFNGLPTRTKLDMMGFNSKTIEKINKRKQKYTIQQIKKNSVKSKEHILVLEYLKNNGYTVACVTNSIRKTAQLMLKHAGLRNYIDLLISNEDVCIPKPDPLPYISAMHYACASPSKTLIFEDSKKGLESALLSGAHVVHLEYTEINTINMMNILQEIDDA